MNTDFINAMINSSDELIYSVMSYTVPTEHMLHSGYAHPVLKHWQSGCDIKPQDLVYPLFVVEKVCTDVVIMVQFLFNAVDIV